MFKNCLNTDNVPDVRMFAGKLFHSGDDAAPNAESSMHFFVIFMTHTHGTKRPSSHLVSPGSVGLHLDALEAVGLHLHSEGGPRSEHCHIDTAAKVYQLQRPRVASEHLCRPARFGQRFPEEGNGQGHAKETIQKLSGSKFGQTPFILTSLT